MISASKIAVIGSNCKLEKHLIKQLLISGYEINILSKSSSLLDFHNEKIKVIEGNAENYLTVLQLVENCSTVFNCINSNQKHLHNNAFISTNILKAMESYQIKRLVSFSDLFIKNTLKLPISLNIRKKIKSVLYSNIISDLENEYDIIANSKVDWTIVRLPEISENIYSNKIKISYKELAGNYISPDSVAKFATSIIKDENYFKSSIFISN